MKALILAGGKGTRLRPLTINTPKPVVPVVNRPFLSYQLDLIAKAEIMDITLSLSYQPNKIEDVMGDGSAQGVRLKYITEPSPMGTGGAYKFATDRTDEAIIVFNGDVLTDFSVAELVEKHRDSKADATIALISVEDPSRYGVVETDADGRVMQFIEKPAADQVGSRGAGRVNAGIYVLEPTVWEMIPEGVPQSFEYEIFPEILRRGLNFVSYSLDGSYFKDIGTLKSYHEAHLDFLSGRVNGYDLTKSSEVDIAATANVDEASILGEGCVVRSNAKITNSVIGPGVQIDENAVIENSVLWSQSRVSSSARVRGAVICRSCHVGRNVVLGEGSVLADDTILPDR
jgi:NDP-sugar pyrophosphorylase family protein